MPEPHLLVISVRGERFRVARYPDYDSAYLTWARADRALREGRLVQLDHKRGEAIPAGTVVPKDGTYLALRSTEDPAWNGLPILTDLAITRSTRGINSQDRAIAALVAAGDSTLHGHTGGWLFTGSDPAHRTCQRTGSQGWNSWWHRNKARHAGEIAFVAYRFHLITPVSKEHA